MSVWNFTATLPALSLGPINEILAEEFDKNQTQIALLTGGLVMGLAWFNFITVPYASNYGRRAAYFWSNLLCIASCIWQALAKDYGSFMAARIVNGLGSAATETIGPMIVSDIFFLHERSTWLAVYLFTNFSGTFIGPVISGAMASSVGWRWFFWLCLILNSIMQVMIFFFLPETKFVRDHRLLETRTAVVQGYQQHMKPTEESQTQETVTSANNPFHTGRPVKSQYTVFPRKTPGASNLRGLFIPIKIFFYPIVFYVRFEISASLTDY